MARILKYLLTAKISHQHAIDPLRIVAQVSTIRLSSTLMLADGIHEIEATISKTNELASLNISFLYAAPKTSVKALRTRLYFHHRGHVCPWMILNRISAITPNINLIAVMSTSPFYFFYNIFRRYAGVCLDYVGTFKLGQQSKSRAK